MKVRTLSRRFILGFGAMLLAVIGSLAYSTISPLGMTILKPGVQPGYEALRYTVKLKGNGTPEQFHEIHETVIKTSPNYFNLSHPIRIDAKLEVE